MQTIFYIFLLWLLLLLQHITITSSIYNSNKVCNKPWYLEHHCMNFWPSQRNENEHPTNQPTACVFHHQRNKQQFVCLADVLLLLLFCISDSLSILSVLVLHIYTFSAPLGLKFLSGFFCFSVCRIKQQIISSCINSHQVHPFVGHATHFCNIRETEY